LDGIVFNPALRHGFSHLNRQRRNDYLHRPAQFAAEQHDRFHYCYISGIVLSQQPSERHPARSRPDSN
jgi:hypothetical protein